tara:strand:+ start:1213 stop:1785 length:573 start_codon:yes stop_codon:yes gene_type:complete
MNCPPSLLKTVRSVHTAADSTFAEKSNYKDHFEGKLNEMKGNGQYRVFRHLNRVRGQFPTATGQLGDLGQTGEPETYTVWCSNDYLGMGQHPSVLEAMHDALDKSGAGSGGTRNIAGSNKYHQELELELGDLHGKSGALVYGSCYVANDATLQALASLLPGVVFFSDAGNHASIIAGIRNSKVGECELTT